MQKASKKKRGPTIARKKKATNPTLSADAVKKGTGLTIPEQIERQQARVRAIKAELQVAQKRALSVERRLIEAMKILRQVSDQPRRSAAGRGLASVGKTAEPPAS